MPLDPALAEAVKAKYPNLVFSVEPSASDPILIVNRDGIRSLAASLKADPDFRFEMLMDLFAVDYLHWEEKENRFEVVYNLYSPQKNRRLILKVLVPETDTAVDSVASVWGAADWACPVLASPSLWRSAERASRTLRTMFRL